MKSFLRQVLAGQPNVTVSMTELFNPADPYPVFWSMADLESWCVTNQCIWTYDDTRQVYVLNKLYS
jgi:hypothetical protein